LFSLFKVLRDYFYIGKREYYGFLTLLFVVVLAIAINSTLKYIGHRQELSVDIEYSNFIPQIPSGDELQVDYPIDLNEVNVEQLKSLGLSGKLSYTIINFKNAIGHYHSMSQLKDVYGMNDSIYEILSANLIIDQSKFEQKKEPKKENRQTLNAKNEISENENQEKSNIQAEKNYVRNEKVKEEIKVVELNSCDSNDLMALPGIGPAYSKRILKYRAMLGGFASIQQLKEVYGIDEQMLKKIENFIEQPDTGLIKKISLNKSEFKELLAHPYIDYASAVAISNARSSEPFKSVEELKTRRIIEEERFEDLKPYFKL